MWRRITYWMGRAWMGLFGWRVEGALPASRKFVFIAAPHTSNWDLPFMMATAYVLGARISWLGKHTLFQGPFGGFMRALGGIPVDRRSRHNVVDQVAQRFQQAEELILGISPE